MRNGQANLNFLASIPGVSRIEWSLYPLQSVTMTMLLKVGELDTVTSDDLYLAPRRHSMAAVCA